MTSNEVRWCHIRAGKTVKVGSGCFLETMYVY